MEQYISKSALVAEIESKKKCAQILGDNAINGSMQQFYDGMRQGCVDILSFINTLEIKEVELEKENLIGTFERKVKIDAGGYPYMDCNIEFYDYDKDIPLAKEGDEVKVIVVKREQYETD